MTTTSSSLAPALLGGAAAGLAVDLTLYPLDTIKTRLQAQHGFQAAGGFKGVYKGLGSVAVGSAPGAAVFFMTYEYAKKIAPRIAGGSDSLTYLISASAGEVAACLIRVPTEVIKQRQQASVYGNKASSLHALKLVLKNNGFMGLYQGYAITVAREIPFSAIQFPIFEYLKGWLRRTRGKPDLPAFPDAALCGSLAGAIAAAATTPLDVAKTRIMLSQATTGTTPTQKQYNSILPTLLRISREEGPRALLKGIAPRVLWIGFGGAVFLGVYEFVVNSLKPVESAIFKNAR